MPLSGAEPEPNAGGRRSIPLFRPYSTEEEVEAVAEVIRSGWWGQGPKTAELEQRFKEVVGASAVVAVSSGTAALHLALLAAGVEPGCEVITPSLTFVSSSHAILYCGATPVFADVDPETLNLDPRDVAKRITARTRAILVVDYGGQPADLEAIQRLAAEHGLVVIEDAAHAAGASYQGQPVGSISPLTCFSFHPVKPLASGDGGVIALGQGADPEWEPRLRRLRWLGIDEDTWQRADRRSAGDYRWQYVVTELGYKYQLNDVLAAIALVQLRRVPSLLARRRAICDRYRAGLADLPWIDLLHEPLDSRSAHHLFVVKVDNREAVRRWLGEHGIGSGVHYTPNHLLAMYAPYAQPLPVTEREHTRLLTLPLYSGMTDTDADYVVEVLRAFRP